MGTEGEDLPPWVEGVEEPDSLETIAKNRWYVLAETEDGYGIWTRDTDLNDAPFANFGEDEAGYIAAADEFKRRTRQMRLFSQLPEILAKVVAVGVILWFVLIVLTSVMAAIDAFATRSSSESELVAFTTTRWFYEFTQVMYAMWLGALALMVALWLLRRARDEPARA